MFLQNWSHSQKEREREREREIERERTFVGVGIVETSGMCVRKYTEIRIWV